MENREKIVDLSPRSRFSKWIGSSVSVHRRIESRQAYTEVSTLYGLLTPCRYPPCLITHLFTHALHSTLSLSTPQQSQCRALLALALLILPVCRLLLCPWLV